MFLACLIYSVLQSDNKFCSYMGHAMSQAVICWCLTTDNLVQSQACLDGIYGGHSGTWRGFLKSTLVFSCLYHSNSA
jgi:hypothetical protein